MLETAKVTLSDLQFFFPQSDLIFNLKMKKILN